MPILQICVTKETEERLRRIAADRGRGETIEHLAENAVEEAALREHHEIIKREEQGK